MKRLTKKEQLAGHTVNYVCYDNCFDVWSVPKKFMGNAIDRLAAYEETGLEPEEIEQLKGEAFGLKVDKQELEQYRALGSIDRLRELKQANDEGRCVVLPCKIFDKVWDVIAHYQFEITEIDILPYGKILFRCGNKGTDDYVEFYDED